MPQKNPNLAKFSLKVSWNCNRSQVLSKKKKKQKAKAEQEKPIVINRSPGFSSRFKDDLAQWLKQDVKIANKTLDLVTAVISDTFQGVGKPETLKYVDPDIWSRRINLEHRLVYRVGQVQIDFLACRYHYG